MSVDLWIVFQESRRLACLSGQRASCALYYCCIRPRVRVNEVRLLSLWALRHHSSDCLRQRPTVGGYASQFARTLLRLCFAKLLVLLVGGPDNFVTGASRAHPTRRLWRGRISWRCGDWEFGRSFSKSPKLQVSQQRKQQRAFVCLCRRSHLVILGNKVGNTTVPVSAMGERWGRYGCKDCLYRVKGSWAMGVRS